LDPVLVKALPADWSLERDGNTRSINRIPDILFKAKILKNIFIITKKKLLLSDSEAM
jgi:hypothetical protein